MLFDEDAAETEGGFARFFSKTPGSYARFFDAFLDDDDAADGRDGLDGVRFEEEEDAYRAYAASSRKQSTKRAAAEDARARAARLRDLEAQRVLDEARRRDAAWRARGGAGADVGKALGKRSRGAVSQTVRGDASAYRRAWGVVAAMADRGEAIAHDDLPWPTSDSGEAAEMREEASRTILGGTSTSVREKLSANDARATLRAEMLRWHPDKFDAKMGGLIVEADRDRVRARVNVVARIVAALFQEARERT